MNKYISAFIVASPIWLAGCVLGTQGTKTQTPSMCWLESPVNNSSFGQIGLARNIDIGGTPPVVKSRMRAIESLADYLDAELSDRHELRSDTLTTQLKGKTIYLGEDSVIDGYVYSYATIDAPYTPRQCQPQKCNISKCEPSWLCSPSSDEQVATLGVSYHASTPVEQHKKSIENALMQAELLYGVDVKAENKYRAKNSESFSYSVYLASGNLDYGDKEKITYAVTDRCFDKGNLYSRVQLYGDVPALETTQIDSKHWLLDPKYGGYDGAVGISQRSTASGLFSDQIKLAIKRAAVQLAFEKESLVSEETTAVQYESGNSILITSTHESTDVRLKAKVLAFAFHHTEGDQLEVYAWVAVHRES